MRKVGGYTAIAVGIFFGLGILLNVGGPHSAAALVLALLVFGGAPLALGIALLRHAPPDAQALQARRAWDSELMRLAARRHGSLTVTEVVTYADLDATRAEQYLDDLCRRGLCEHRVTDDGQVVYRFESAPSAAAKLRARGVLDD